MNGDTKPILAGPITNLVISSIIGALLGGGGATYWQSVNPKVEVFTSSRFEAFKENELQKIKSDIWSNTQHIGEHGNKIDWIARQLGECEKYRAKDDDRVEALGQRVRELEYEMKRLTSK